MDELVQGIQVLLERDYLPHDELVTIENQNRTMRP